MTDAEAREIVEGLVPATLVAKVQWQLDEPSLPLEGQFCIDDYPEVYEKRAGDK